MSNNEAKKHLRKQPIEKDNTAALANVSVRTLEANVTVPSDFAMENAQDRVDSDEK
jgi:hypothetical protein